MLNGKQRPNCAWETSSMEEDSYCPCCCGEEERLHRQKTSKLLHKREKRLTRTVYFLTVAILVISAALTLLVVLLGTRARDTSDSQTKTPPDGIPSDLRSAPQRSEERDMKPSAMVTAPDGSYTDEKYLQWQSVLGNVHCKGGLNCSSVNLVVPRDGIYKVYLQITYQGELNNRDITLSNTVNVFHEAYAKDKALLSSFDTVNKGMADWTKSLRTSGTFVLKANSKLRVTSNAPELIFKTEESTFFGVELQQYM